MARSCHSKVFLPSKSVFKRQEQIPTLPPCTGETAVKKETSCGRGGQNWPRRSSQHGKEAHCHIPRGPECLSGSTLDLRDTLCRPKARKSSQSLPVVWPPLGRDDAAPSGRRSERPVPQSQPLAAAPPATKPGVMTSPAPLPPPVRWNDFLHLSLQLPTGPGGRWKSRQTCGAEGR